MPPGSLRATVLRLRRLSQSWQAVLDPINRPMEPAIPHGRGHQWATRLARGRQTMSQVADPGTGGHDWTEREPGGSHPTDLAWSNRCDVHILDREDRPMRPIAPALAVVRGRARTSVGQGSHAWLSGRLNAAASLTSSNPADRHFLTARPMGHVLSVRPRRRHVADSGGRCLTSDRPQPPDARANSPIPKGHDR